NVPGRRDARQQRQPQGELLVPSTPVKRAAVVVIVLGDQRNEDEDVGQREQNRIASDAGVLDDKQRREASEKRERPQVLAVSQRPHPDRHSSAASTCGTRPSSASTASSSNATQKRRASNGVRRYSSMTGRHGSPWWAAI